MIRHAWHASVVLVMLLAQIGPGAAVTGASSTRAEVLGPALQGVIDSQRLSLNIPGLSSAVIFGDGSRWSGVSGQAAVDPDSAVAPETPFVAGSITKTYVGSLILDLRDEGSLSIDDAISRWLPDYPNAANITVRQLLSHTSGIFDYFRHGSFGPQVYGHPNRQWTPQEILTTFSHAPYFVPGTDYHYSNTNYVLLGLIAEAVGGAPLGDQLRSRYWNPLGLEDTFIQSAGPPPANAAMGYLRKTGHLVDIGDASGYRPTRSAASVAWGVGDLVAAAGDIATWADALYGGDVLEPASLAEMLDWGAYPGSGDYGLGVQTREYNGHRMYGHTGSLRGFVAAVWHVPARDTTFVVMTNRGRTNAQVSVTNALIDVAFAEADTIAPSVPGGLTAIPGANRHVQVSWNPATDNVPGGIRYRVFRDGSAIAALTMDLSLTDQPKAGRHTYRVRAIDAAGNRGGKSLPVSAVAN